jgi:hypothetical protein
MKQFALIAFVIAIAVLASAQQPPAEQKPEVPVLDAAIGPCTADFFVKDASGKAVYAAKIHTLIRYGAFGVKKQELQLSTNYNGEARITGLPDVNKKPTQFDISKDKAKVTVAYDPGQDCHPKYDVTLK